MAFRQAKLGVTSILIMIDYDIIQYYFVITALEDWGTLSEENVLPIITSVCKDKYEAVLPKVISAFQ